MPPNKTLFLCSQTCRLGVCWRAGDSGCKCLGLMTTTESMAACGHARRLCHTAAMIDIVVCDPMVNTAYSAALTAKNGVTCS